MTILIEERTFTFDAIEELVDLYSEESEDLGNAALTFIDGILTLTTIEFKDSVVIVYRTTETPELYQQMEEKYLKIIDGDDSSGSDFWDKWTAFIETLTPHKIVDETLNP